MKPKSINNTCQPKKPNKAETKAIRCLNVLLDGGVINRKTLGELSIARYNDSAHSLISILRNEHFIPIESLRQPDGTSNYIMLPSEIIRYKDPLLRPQQKEEMKALVEEKRQRKITALLAKQKSDKKWI